MLCWYCWCMLYWCIVLARWWRCDVYLQRIGGVTGKEFIGKHAPCQVDSCPSHVVSRHRIWYWILL